MIDGSPSAAVALFVVGAVSGVINTVAGGGSLLTLPALMLVGLPADVANGTNRLGVVAQSAAGVSGFAARGLYAPRQLLPVVSPTVVGAALGALAATRVSAEALEVVLLVTLVAMASVMTAAPATAFANGSDPPVRPGIGGTIALVAAGFYGGFVQAGVGFVLLAVLGGVLRYDVGKANALKTLATLAFGAASLLVFAAAGQVAWGPAIALAVGSAVGGRLGAALALSGSPLIRFAVLVMVWVSCAAAALR